MLYFIFQPLLFVSSLAIVLISFLVTTTRSFSNHHIPLIFFLPPISPFISPLLLTLLPIPLVFTSYSFCLYFLLLLSLPLTLLTITSHFSSFYLTLLFLLFSDSRVFASHSSCLYCLLLLYLLPISPISTSHSSPHHLSLLSPSPPTSPAFTSSPFAFTCPSLAFNSVKEVVVLCIGNTVDVLCSY